MKIRNLYIKDFKGLRKISITNCSRINAFLGKNNSGKSSILHAIDITSLAISVQNWNNFQPKLEIKDLINNAGDFEIKIDYEPDIQTTVKSNTDFNPVIEQRPTDAPKSILILPDVGLGMLSRQHRTPQWVI